MSGGPATLCLDCLAGVDGDRRCAACGSPRLARHPRLHELTIAHVDCDAFYAAIEKRDDPSLADRPVIVGGGRRGVVATACYVARTFGVRSAMPMFKALAACPEAVVIRPDMAKYAAVARRIRGMMEELTPLVEPVSIDEAFLDLSGTYRLHGASPATVLARFAARVEAQIGVTVSIGLSYCKFLAKIASDLDKPRGFAAIGRQEAPAFLAQQPVSLIWGVGAAFRARLEADGLRTIGDVQKADPERLLRLYGVEGQRLWRLARGEDARPVDPQRETKSVSAEMTFAQDIADPAELTRILYALSEKVSARLIAKNLGACGVSLKLKRHDFRVLTRARRLAEPTRLAARLFEAARELLGREADGVSFRLIGLAAHDLVAADLADLGDLADPAGPKLRARQEAVDRLRARFGGQAVVRGIAFGPPPRGRR